MGLRELLIPSNASQYFLAFPDESEKMRNAHWRSLTYTASTKMKDTLQSRYLPDTNLNSRENGPRGQNKLIQVNKLGVQVSRLILDPGGGCVT